MRKIIWLILILIALLWIAIAQLWTGTDNQVKTYDFPEAAPTISIEVPEALPEPSSFSAQLASPSATPTLFP